MRKIIGVTGPSAYSPFVHKMIEYLYGAMPFYILQNHADDLAWISEHIDGLILAGGSDICPITYGQDMLNKVGFSKFDLPRDKREIALIKLLHNLNKPIFGICRGHQLMGLLNGIPLIKDISNSDVCHNPSNAGIKTEQIGGDDDLPVHFVEVFEEFRQEFFDKQLVNSWHHQALRYSSNIANKIAKDVEIIGISIVDFKYQNSQAVENIELMRGFGDKNRWISCQWHPELDYKSNAASFAVTDVFKKMLG